MAGAMALAANRTRRVRDEEAEVVPAAMIADLVALQCGPGSEDPRALSTWPVTESRGNERRLLVLSRGVNGTDLLLKGGGDVLAREKAPSPRMATPERLPLPGRLGRRRQPRETLGQGSLEDSEVLEQELDPRAPLLEGSDECTRRTTRDRGDVAKPCPPEHNRERRPLRSSPELHVGHAVLRLRTPLAVNTDEAPGDGALEPGLLVLGQRVPGRGIEDKPTVAAGSVRERTQPELEVRGREQTRGKGVLSDARGRDPQRNLARHGASGSLDAADVLVVVDTP